MIFFLGHKKNKNNNNKISRRGTNNKLTSQPNNNEDRDSESVESRPSANDQNYEEHEQSSRCRKGKYKFKYEDF